MAEQRVVILGEAWVDEIRDPGGMRERVTGDAVELATALRGDGLVVTVVTPLGDDADGERVRTALHDRGIRLVPVPAPEGTLRRSIVRDRAGAEIELRRGNGAFPDTRRSLAAQTEADVIVDLRDRAITTVAEARDEVLAALGLAVVAPASLPQESVLREGDAVEEAASDGALADAPADGALADASAENPMVVEAPGRPLLLPAPIVAGTYRHSPVQLLPAPPAAHAPAPDWYGLEARIARVAT
ncbi:hypothetical protein [Microbacterium sp. 2MCAF23]|uniref:hypothetical protein n=1 Tax=Microbacterium sp. 2MCAF23 TaxID=3232985 RepID=UPI003F97A2C1